MKKYTKTQFLLAGVVACAVLGAAATTTNAPTQVGATATNVSTALQMKEGASLYLKTESGLRFGYTVSDYNAEAGKNYGMLIVPFDYLAKAEISLTDSVADDYVMVLNQAYADEKIPYAPTVQENLAPITENGEQLFTFSVKNLKEQNYVREFFGIGFEKTDSGYIYATQNDNVRSVFEVANNALNKLNYGTWGTDEAAIAEKELLQANEETVLNPFVQNGFAFVYDGASLVSDNTYVGGQDVSLTTELTKQTDKASIDLESQMTWVYAAEDSSVASIAQDGKITPKKFGEATLTATLGDAITLEKEVFVYADEAQYTQSKNYAADAVSGQNRVTFNEDGSVTLKSETAGDGYIASLRGTSLAYVAYAGEYGTDTYIDIEFTGNNMPIVRLFADEINGRIATYADETATGDAGVLFINGVGTNEHAGALQPASGYFINESLYTEAMSNQSASLGIYNPGYFMTGFKMASLMETPTQEYKYTVGSFKDEDGNVVANAILYKKTTEGAWELVHSALRPLTVTGSTYAAANIVVMTALKGEGETNTFKCSLPYQKAGENGTVVGHNALWTEQANGYYDVTMYSKNKNTATESDKNDDYSYVAFTGKEYGVGTYMDFEFTGTQIPIVRMFANNVNGFVSTAVDTTVKGLFFNNGYRHADNMKYWKAHYNDGGLNCSGTWVPYGSRMLSFGLDANTQYKYTVGTYLDSDNTVVLEWRLYSKASAEAEWTEITYSEVENHAVENTKDTGISATSWFESGSIVLLPPIGAGNGTVNSFTCKVYKK